MGLRNQYHSPLTSSYCAVAFTSTCKFNLALLLVDSEGLHSFLPLAVHALRNNAEGAKQNTTLNVHVPNVTSQMYRAFPLSYILPGTRTFYKEFVYIPHFCKCEMKNRIPGSIPNYPASKFEILPES